MAMIVSSMRVYVTTSDLVILPFSSEAAFSTTTRIDCPDTNPILIPAAVYNMPLSYVKESNTRFWNGHINAMDFTWSMGEFRYCRNLISKAPKSACLIPLTDHLQQMLDSFIANIY